MSWPDDAAINVLCCISVIDLSFILFSIACNDEGCNSDIDENNGSSISSSLSEESESSSIAAATVDIVWECWG